MASPLRGAEILLVEDLPDVTLLIRKVLEGEGAIVSEARTAGSGLATAAETRPHLVVCDLGLIGSGAFHLLEELRKARGLSQVPVLAVSQPKDRSLILRAMGMGVMDCALKPLQAGVLVRKAERLMGASPYGTILFEEKERPRASLTVPMDIVRLGENGFSIEAPVALASEAEVRIECDLLRELGCGAAVTRSSADNAGVAGLGRSSAESYLNDINLLGLEPQAAKRIRGFLKQRGWEEELL